MSNVLVRRSFLAALMGCLLFGVSACKKDDDEDKKDYTDYTGVLNKVGDKWELDVSGTKYKLNLNDAKKLPDLETLNGKTVVVNAKPGNEGKLRVKTVKAG